MTPAEVAARRSVFLTSSHDLLKPLPEIAESIQAQLLEAHKRPTPERLERLALELDGIRRHVLTCRAALQREADGGRLASGG